MIKVGSVNMGVHEHGAIYERFNLKGNIPRIIILAPHQTSAFNDYETFPQEGMLDLLLANMLAMCRKVLKSHVPSLRVPEEFLSQGSEGPNGNSLLLGMLKKPTMVLVTRPSSCENCAKLRPVFRRMSSALQGSGWEFVQMDCNLQNVGMAKLCQGRFSFPDILIVTPSTKAVSSLFLVSPSFHGDTADKFDYDESQLSLAMTMGMVAQFHATDDMEEEIPEVLVVSGGGKNYEFAQGRYLLQSARSGNRPMWKSERTQAYIRFVPGQFRQADRGTWLLTNTDKEDVDAGWAHLTAEESFLPTSSTKLWICHLQIPLKTEKPFTVVVEKATGTQDSEEGPREL